MGCTDFFLYPGPGCRQALYAWLLHDAILRVSTCESYTPLTGLEFHLWIRHDKSINFSFCKGHFHWKTLKSMGSFWRGTKAKNKTRGNEGHSPRGLPQNSCVANDMVPVIIKCLIVSAFSSLTIVTKGKQTTTDPYSMHCILPPS